MVWSKPSPTDSPMRFGPSERSLASLRWISETPQTSSALQEETGRQKVHQPCTVIDTSFSHHSTPIPLLFRSMDCTILLATYSFGNVLYPSIKGWGCGSVVNRPLPAPMDPFSPELKIRITFCTCVSLPLLYCTNVVLLAWAVSQSPASANGVLPHLRWFVRLWDVPENPSDWDFSVLIFERERREGCLDRYFFGWTALYAAFSGSRRIFYIRTYKLNIMKMRLGSLWPALL